MRERACNNNTFFRLLISPCPFLRLDPVIINDQLCKIPNVTCGWQKATYRNNMYTHQTSWICLPSTKRCRNHRCREVGVSRGRWRYVYYLGSRYSRLARNRSYLKIIFIVSAIVYLLMWFQFEKHGTWLTRVVHFVCVYAQPLKYFLKGHDHLLGWLTVARIVKIFPPTALKPHPDERITHYHATDLM